MNLNMKAFFRPAAACAASLFIFQVCAKAAGEPVPSAIKVPAPAPAVSPAQKVLEPATSYAETPDSREDVIGHSEFDEFSSVSDPLYREGSKILLQKAIDEDNSPKAPVKPAPVKKNIWRDAPADIPAKTAPPALIKDNGGTKAPIFPAKKNRLIKMIPADPVESRSTL